MPQFRENGFYWCFHMNEWKIAMWYESKPHHGFWYLHGSMEQIPDGAMKKVDPNRLLSPAYQQKGMIT